MEAQTDFAKPVEERKTTDSKLDKPKDLIGSLSKDNLHQMITELRK